MSASKRRPIAALGVALVGSLSLGCHDSTAPPGGGVPSFNHVFIVVEENTDYASVIGSSSMPYLNGLAQQYGLATQYYADTHPSIGNYFMMTVGKIITNDDNYSSVVTDDNVVRRLLAAGKIVATFTSTARWLDMGRFEDLQRAGEIFAEARSEFLPQERSGRPRRAVPLAG